MPDNDFWIGREQIPVDLSLLLTYSNDEDYWYAPGEYALRVYTVDTLNTNFARPCFAFGERTSDPEMEDVSGAIENTLHELLDSGATPVFRCHYGKGLHNPYAHPSPYLPADALSARGS